MNHRTHLVALGANTLIAGLVLAACGGYEDNATTDTGTGAGQTTTDSSTTDSIESPPSAAALTTANRCPLPLEPVDRRNTTVDVDALDGDDLHSVAGKSIGLTKKNYFKALDQLWYY